jgi:hypothetical protein
MLDQLIQGLQRKNLSTGRQQQLFHILAPDPESAAGNACDYLKFRVVCGPALNAEGVQVLNTGNFVPSRSIVFSQFGLNYDLWVIFAWDNEIRRLIEARYTLGALGFAVADAGLRKHVFDYGFETIAD